MVSKASYLGVRVIRRGLGEAIYRAPCSSWREGADTWKGSSHWVSNSWMSHVKASIFPSLGVGAENNSTTKWSPHRTHMCGVGVSKLMTSGWNPVRGRAARRSIRDW